MTHHPWLWTLHSIEPAESHCPGNGLAADIAACPRLQVWDVQLTASLRVRLVNNIMIEKEAQNRTSVFNLYFRLLYKKSLSPTRPLILIMAKIKMAGPTLSQTLRRQLSSILIKSEWSVPVENQQRYIQKTELLNAPVARKDTWKTDLIDLKNTLTPNTLTLLNN